MSLRGTESSSVAAGAPNTSMGNAFSNARTSGAAAPAGSAAPAGKGGQGPRPGGFSFRDLGKLTASPMGRTPASEVLTKLTKALETVYEGVNKMYEVVLVPVDMNSNSALNVSVLIVAMRELADKDLGVAFHTLILEGSVEPIAPKFENINGQNVERIITVGEANDARMGEVVADQVARMFPQSKLYNADACVVPRDFDLTDEALVYNLASNAAYAISTELETKRADFQDMNLANATRDETLTLRTAFVNTQSMNAVGQPVRSDITIDLSAVAANQGQQNLQSVDRVTPVSRISGFMDLVWDPASPQANPYQPYQGVQANFQRYAPRFVMTSMETVAVLTPATQLMTLVTALALRDNNGWVQAFRPQPFAGADVDMRDIGAIGIEANFEMNPNGIGSRVDTKSDSFKPDSLAKLVSAVIKPGLILSLDVEETGPTTWFNGVFAAAAEGNAKANEILVEAANVLTNGAFGRHFPQNGRVAVDENNRIHLGYYTDRNGVRRDIRDIDYLAVLNLVGEKDPEVARDWSDTFQRIQYPLIQRLAARKRIITGLFSNVVFTGFARRVTFEAGFMEALATGCQECGLDVRAVTPYADMGSFERATAQFTGSTLLPSGSSALFNRASSGGYQGNMGGNRSFGTARWF